MSEVEKILLVDDEPGIRESVQAYLSCNENWQVEVARDVNEAWEKIRETKPDIIVSDIMMPEVNGLEFLAQLREDSRYRNLPVVLLTAKGMTSDRIEGYTVGCDAYLPKPFDPEELEAIVKNLLDKQKLLQESQDGNAQLDELMRDVKDIKDKLESTNRLTTTEPTIKIDLTP